MGAGPSRKHLPESADCRCDNDLCLPWELEFSACLENWKYSAVLWGFDPRIDYTSNVKTRLHPWCMRGRHFTVRHDRRSHDGDRPNFMVKITEDCFRQDTVIRLPAAYRKRLANEAEPSSHYLKPIQMVGYRDGIAILQIICCDSFMEFLVIHMKTGVVAGIFKELVTKPYLCDCIISPDLSTFILKPNAMYVLNFCRGEYKNEMKVISCKEKYCPVLKSMFQGRALRPLIDFDPRYKKRRIVVGNCLRNGRDVLCVYDLTEEEFVAESDHSKYQTTHNIVFSPDGLYIASLILGRSVKDGLFNFPRVLVYSSDDLVILQSLSLENLAEVPTLSPTALFPLFSEPGSHLAVAYGEQGTFYHQVAGVRVYRLPMPLDLQNLCRLVIRQYYDRQDVDGLPLPNKLKAYLRFQPCLD